jgi:hypothetical protein
VELDHHDGRAHDPGELEGCDAGGKRAARERRAEVIDPRRPRDPRRLSGGRPFATPEIVEVDPPATAGREDERRIQPSRNTTERLERAL